MYVKWWKNSKIVSIPGAYLKVDDDLWEITKVDCEGGDWTSGRTIHDFWLKQIE